MTLNSELTVLMDKARNLTGLTDKISIDRLTGINSTTTAQIISDENTSQGTVFIWNLPIGTYYPRVNAYHKSTNDNIYASNIRIYEI